MGDVVKGHLLIGIDPDTKEVVVNCPAVPDFPGLEDGWHYCFSPDQARALARNLIRQADTADTMRGRSPN